MKLIIELLIGKYSLDEYINNSRLAVFMRPLIKTIAKDHEEYLNINICD